jgi:hypothetical protein
VDGIWFGRRRGSHFRKMRGGGDELSQNVMAGLVPAIHVLLSSRGNQTKRAFSARQSLNEHLCKQVSSAQIGFLLSFNKNILTEFHMEHIGNYPHSPKGRSGGETEREWGSAPAVTVRNRGPGSLWIRPPGVRQTPRARSLHPPGAHWRNRGTQGSGAPGIEDAEVERRWRSRPRVAGPVFDGARDSLAPMALRSLYWGRT